MSDNVLARISAALRKVLLETNYSDAVSAADGGQCVQIDGMVDPDDLADAVIAELGLREEWAVERRATAGRELLGDCKECDHEATHDEKSVADYYRNILPVEQKATLAHRYVTDWKADDE